MQEKKYTASDKVVHKMSRDGLTEENLRTGDKQSIHEWRRLRSRPAEGGSELKSEAKLQREALKKEMVKLYAQKKKQMRTEELSEDQLDKVESAGEQAHSPQESDSAKDPESLETAEDVSPSDVSERVIDRGGHTAAKTNGHANLTGIRSAHTEPETRKRKSASKSPGKEKAQSSAKKIAKSESGKKTAGKKGEAAKDAPKKESKLHFEDEDSAFVRGEGMGFHKKAASAVVTAAGGVAHRKVSQESDDNSGVEAAHDAELTAEASVRQIPRRIRSMKTAEDAPSVKDKTKKFYQKQRYKKAYKEARRTGETTGKTAAAAQTAAEKVKAVVSNTFRNNRTILIVLGICGLLFGLIAVSVSSSSSLVQGLGGAVMTTTYPSKDVDIHQAENAYVALEQSLNNQINRMEQTHPGYDEYRYQVDEIGHNPYQLISYLTAVFSDFEYADVSAEINDLFSQQYRLEVSEQVEIRTRTETRTETSTYTDPETGETYEDEYEYEVEVEYEYYILCISLKNFGFDITARNRMTADQIKHYEILNTTYGNRKDLFDLDSIPSFDGTTVPIDRYEIPPEALSDTKFANMIREAEKYLGYPYVWGGSSPSTSFDCSGFVCWVINNCGNGWNVGRTTAEGLRQMCSYVSPSEAKPGDIIFFEGTYDTSGASHVGIYVGNGKMIHCGSVRPAGRK